MVPLSAQTTTIANPPTKTDNNIQLRKLRNVVANSRWMVATGSSIIKKNNRPEGPLTPHWRHISMVGAPAFLVLASVALTFMAVQGISVVIGKTWPTEKNVMQAHRRTITKVVYNSLSRVQNILRQMGQWRVSTYLRIECFSPWALNL